MPTVIRRPSGIYYGVFFQQGRRIWRSTGSLDPDEAKRIVTRMSVEFVSYRHLKLLELSQLLLELQINTMAGTTNDLYRQAFSAFAQKIGNLPLQLITAYHVDKFKAERLKEVSPAKVSIDFRTLRAAFNRAVKYRMIDENPFKDCRDVTIPEKEPKFLSATEFQHLINHVLDPRLLAVILVAAGTGMRAGEIINLHCEDIDFEGGFIHLKNRDSHTLKSKRMRSVPMNKMAREGLRMVEWGSRYVFDRERRLQRPVASISRRFKRCVRKARLSERVHFHTLRHTAASWLASAGVPLSSIKQILGHQSITTTLIYTHEDADHLREAMGRIDDICLN